MLKKTKIKIICENKLVNTYSKRSGGYGGWSNPFEVIPMVGDYITLTQGDDNPVSYQVKSREFCSNAKYIGIYDEQEVILNVVEKYKPTIEEVFEDKSSL